MLPRIRDEHPYRAYKYSQGRSSTTLRKQFEESCHRWEIPQTSGQEIQLCVGGAGVAARTFGKLEGANSINAMVIFTENKNYYTYGDEMIVIQKRYTGGNSSLRAKMRKQLLRWLHMIRLASTVVEIPVLVSGWVDFGATMINSVAYILIMVGLNYQSFPFAPEGGFPDYRYRGLLDERLLYDAYSNGFQPRVGRPSHCNSITANGTMPIPQPAGSSPDIYLDMELRKRRG
ncbi:hypothetical protein BD779DRAFT_1475838 [Infundibulicybe gibba]|nr:hypothetical protein BD779DRAFT_1475838 [Infundibulicybe gibba]